MNTKKEPISINGIRTTYAKNQTLIATRMWLYPKTKTQGGN